MKEWTPNVGDLVVYRCRSAISGALVNLRLEEVTKRTSAGFISLKGAPGNRYKSGALDAYYEHRPRYLGVSNYIVVLTKPSADDLATLPRTSHAGNLHARAIQAALRK